MLDHPWQSLYTQYYRTVWWNIGLGIILSFPFILMQKVTFGMATVNDGSPSIHLLRDLQKKGLPLDAFISCLEKIGCQGALNEFVSASEKVQM